LSRLAQSIRSDVVAGVVAAIVSLPFCVGFGLMAFEPLGPAHSAFAVQAGLCGGFASGLLAALLGGTRAQISAPIVAGALLLADFLRDLSSLSGASAEGFEVQVGLVAIVVALAGLLQISFGALRLGGLVRYLAYPVVIGLMASVGILTAKGQLVEFLGPGGVEGWERAPWSPAAIATLATGTLTLAVVVLGKRVLPRVPGPVLGLAVGVVFAAALRFAGGPMLSVPRLAPLASAVPMPIDPSPALHAVRALGPAWLLRTLLGPVLSIALFSSLNSLLSSSVADALTGAQHDANRELVGQGVGNLGAAVFGGVPGGGLASLSALNWNSGGRTRLAGAVHGISLLVFLVAGGSMMAIIPRVVLAAIVVVTAAALFDPWIFRLLRALFDPKRRADRADTLVNLGLMVAVCVAALVGGLVNAIVVGVLASSAYFIFRIGRVRYRLAYRGNQVHSKRARPLEDLERLSEDGRSIAVFELAGAIFFGSADALVRRVEKDAEGATEVILGLHAVDEIDASGLRVLLQFVSRMEREGRQVLFGNMTAHHRSWPRLLNTGIREEEIQRHFFSSTDLAHEAAEDRLLERMRPGADRGAGVPVAGTDLFRGLPDDLVAWLHDHVEHRRYERGAVIVAAGATDRSLYVLTSGTVSVVAGDGGDGQETTRLAGFAAGTVFGEIALLDAGPRSASVVADDVVACSVLSVDAFADLRLTRPDLAFRLLENLSLGMARRLRAATEQIRTLLA
jgi:MFS superfamily sulfate permease-like transporter